MSHSVVCCLGLLALVATAPPLWADDGLPVLDNELLLAVEGGVLLSREASADGDTIVDVGGQGSLQLGLFERARDWLDAEMSLGVVFLASREGFEQSARGVSTRQSLLVGGALRGALRLHFADAGGLLLPLGLEAQLVSAPAVGTAFRTLLQAGLGLDLWRTAREHGSLELVWAWAFFDELAHDSVGLGDAQSLGLRLSLGF